MTNKKNILIIAAIVIGLTSFFSFRSTTQAESTEIKIVTVVESIVPMGIGRSRIVESQQDLDYKPLTTENTTQAGKQKNKSNRKSIKIDNYSETKLLNFYSATGINFQNISSNDAVISSKINDMIKEGWELVFVNTGVESDAGKGDGTGIYITRLTFKRVN